MIYELNIDIDMLRTQCRELDEIANSDCDMTLNTQTLRDSCTGIVNLLDEIIAQSEMNNQDSPRTFRNEYLCSECGHNWSMTWECTCDDRCPKCGVAMTPFRSTDVN